MSGNPTTNENEEDRPMLPSDWRAYLREVYEQRFPKVTDRPFDRERDA